MTEGNQSLDPASVRNKEELAALLRQVRVQAGSPPANDIAGRYDNMSKAAIYRVLNGTQLPSAPFLRNFLRAHGIEDDAHTPWLIAQDRLNPRRPGPSSDDVELTLGTAEPPALGTRDPTLHTPLRSILHRDLSSTNIASTSVFLCHSKGDKEAVRDLYLRLVRDGLTCWFDEESLLPGQDWEREISIAIKRSKFVLACISSTSISRNGYVQKELKTALDFADQQPEGSIYLIPVRLEDCDIPERLKHLHWVDLYQPSGYEKLLKSLSGYGTGN